MSRLPDYLVDIVARFRNVDPLEIHRGVRGRKTSWPRQEVVYLLIKHTGLGANMISEAVDLNMTTALYSVGAVQSRIWNLPDYKAEVEEIEAVIIGELSRRGLIQ
jgi:chromosomal replication initiation ATPase DnaA